MKLTSTVAVLALCASAAIAQPKPPATQPAFSISNTRVQTLAAQTYLYTETETTLADMKPVVEKQMTALMKLDEQKKIEGAGPVVFVYQGMTWDAKKPFKLQIGMLVADTAKPAGDFKVRPLEKFKAVTILFGGSMDCIGQAHGMLMGGVFQNKHEPTGESREYYVYWEGPRSPNTVVLMGMGIK